MIIIILVSDLYRQHPLKFYCRFEHWWFWQFGCLCVLLVNVVFNIISKILYISTLLIFNISPGKVQKMANSCEEAQIWALGRERRRAVLWWRLLLAAEEICCELQCRTPPHIAAAELTHLRGRAGRLSYSTRRQDKEKEKPAMRRGGNWARSFAWLFSWMNWTSRDPHALLLEFIQ